MDGQSHHALIGHSCYYTALGLRTNSATFRHSRPYLFSPSTNASCSSVVQRPGHGTSSNRTKPFEIGGRSRCPFGIYPRVIRRTKHSTNRHCKQHTCGRRSGLIAGASITAARHCFLVRFPIQILFEAFREHRAAAGERFQRSIGKDSRPRRQFAAANPTCNRRK